MKVESLNKICLSRGVLLDSYFRSLLREYDEDFVLEFINFFMNHTGKKFINRDLMSGNKRAFLKFLEDWARRAQFDLEGLKNKFGLGSFEGQSKKSNFQEQKFSDNLKENLNEGRVKILSSFHSVSKPLEVKDFINYFRNRYSSLRDTLCTDGELENLVSISKIPSERGKVSVIGMISEKKMTKNNNFLFEVEDLSGKMKVLVSSEKQELIKEAEDIPLDGVIGFSGIASSKTNNLRKGERDIIMFADKIVFPEVKLSSRKKSPVEEYALFIGDLHYGSKNFLRDDFLKFIDYLNGKQGNLEEVMKIKYLFIVGDLVTGVGNYPNQERDLVVADLEAQFEGVADLLKKIRKDIKIIISPGNHDGVRIMEPQPILNERFAWALHDLENVILTENPAIVNIGSSDDFEGYNVLTYHGFSFPYYANNVPKLMITNSMNEPEKIMKYLLKNRHLAPTHGSTQYFPMDDDPLLIRRAPDIFLSGHTHKSGVIYQNNVLIISSSSWESLTPYQEKFGNIPDHCKVPMLNLKTRQIKILDFESKKND